MVEGGVAFSGRAARWRHVGRHGFGCVQIVLAYGEVDLKL